MQFRTIPVLLFAAVAAAADNSTLTGLVSQLPTCALSCFEKGAEAANCTVTDFSCLCGTGQSAFKASAGSCVLTSAACSESDTNSAVSLAQQICTEEADNPSSADVASASAAVSSAVAAASTNGPAPAVTPFVGAGLLGGAAALAAYAL